ncbi:fumarylacetoacetate hydrolase family protein [Peribacillus frigoritolerans]|uniref:2-keto-4-pentenoate hydratase n=1 Tax=Peribacillus frigoritolerans TaxID=450367 RepID=UPI002B24940A|nr:fumarylacetoacetate hydrolase family protein [Peribacillus frigoritolerans]MEB2631183.1 fumarylacetoacetate hydrolase family protein [Peribacillus frigoritolerans]
MTLTKGADVEIVEYLFSAEKEVREVIKVTNCYPDLTIEKAYDLQQQLIERKIKEGAKHVGVKLGLTSKAKQEMMGINEAIYGYLLNDMLSTEWEPIDSKELIHPKAEPEIAFLIGEDLQGTNVTSEDVLKAVKYVAPALEIIDSRYLNFKFTLPDVVADNCSSARFVVGSKWVKPEQLDLASVGMVMSKNGEVATVGAGAAVLGHPATAVAWAVNKLGQRNEGLKKGDIVLTGALSEAIAFEAGDSIIAQFDGLGSVSFFCK